MDTKAPQTERESVREDEANDIDESVEGTNSDSDCNELGEDDIEVNLEKFGDGMVKVGGSENKI